MCNMDLNVILKTTTGRKEEEKSVLNPIFKNCVCESQGMDLANTKIQMDWSTTY